jgi:hypothetical protein
MRLAERPPVFSRLADAGGVLDAFVFKDADSMDGDGALAAILAAMPHVNGEKLRASSFRKIDAARFLGSWCDPATGALIRRGSTGTKERGNLEDPKLTDLEGLTLEGGGYPIPPIGGGGEFAYAFSWPPYGLRGRPMEIQRLFDEVRDYILPPGRAHLIFDWTDPRLQDASPYFLAGMDWWGVFLFTVHVPDFKRLVVIAASATD